jgi:hypothetical protein
MEKDDIKVGMNNNLGFFNVAQDCVELWAYVLAPSFQVGMPESEHFSQITQ